MDAVHDEKPVVKKTRDEESCEEPLRYVCKDVQDEPEVEGGGLDIKAQLEEADERRGEVCRGRGRRGRESRGRGRQDCLHVDVDESPQDDVEDDHEDVQGAKAKSKSTNGIIMFYITNMCTLGKLLNIESSWLLFCYLASGQLPLQGGQKFSHSVRRLFLFS